MSSYFPNRWPLSYLYLTKKYVNIHKAPTAQKYFKHQDIKQKEPPQKYRLDDSLDLKDSLKLRDSPLDVSVLDGNHIVVTFENKLSQQLQTIQVFPQMKTEQVFSDKYYTRGVTVFGDVIYASCHVGDPFRGQVRGFDKQGKKKSETAMFAKKSYMFQVPNYIALNNDRDMMCVSDLGDDSVTCMTTDGDVIYKYEAEDMTQSQGVCFDDSHKVLVCESDSTCITKIDG